MTPGDDLHTQLAEIERELMAQSAHAERLTRASASARSQGSELAVDLRRFARSARRLIFRLNWRWLRLWLRRFLWFRAPRDPGSA